MVFFSPDMQRCLKLFKDGSIALLEANQTWMRCCETVRMEVLPLSPDINRQHQRRRTFDLKNRLLSIEQLVYIDL